MLRNKAFDTSLAELVNVLSVVMYDITTQFVGGVYLWSAWLFDYRLREETRWMIMRRPDHCWSTMSRQTRTDQSRTPIWSKCHHATPCASRNMVYIHTKNYCTITDFFVSGVITYYCHWKGYSLRDLFKVNEESLYFVHKKNLQWLYIQCSCNVTHGKPFLTRMVTLSIADLSVTTFARQ